MTQKVHDLTNYVMWISMARMRNRDAFDRRFRAWSDIKGVVSTMPVPRALAALSDEHTVELGMKIYLAIADGDSDFAPPPAEAAPTPAPQPASRPNHDSLEIREARARLFRLCWGLREPVPQCSTLVEIEAAIAELDAPW